MTFKILERSILFSLEDSWVCSLLFFAVGGSIGNYAKAIKADD